MQAKIGSGLHNLGNTCFFNAVMQVMLYTPSLAHILNAKIHSSSCTRNQWCIFCALERLWHDSKKNRVVSPNGIVSNLRFVFKKFRLGRQEDSHQFLRYLVEGIQQVETGKLGKDRQKNQKLILKTNTFHTFGGIMRTFVLCLNCHHKSLHTERYYDLSIQCQRSNTLLEGLQSYFKVDDLTGSNKYRCDSCKQLSNAKKGFKIITIPSVVTFQLKRFTNSLRKIGKLMEYPKTLDLSRYMDHEHQGQNAKLDLYGVIVHSGSSAGSGHYYAFVKNGNQWFEMNDSNVSRCNEDRVLRQQAYLLFYTKTKSDKPYQPLQEVRADQKITEVLTNIKQTNQHEVKISLNNNPKVEQTSREKQKQRNKSIQVKKPPRKQSEEQLDQIKRKLSMDIEQIKQQVHQANKNEQKKTFNKIELNGKIVNSPIFGQGKPNGIHKTEIDKKQDEKNLKKTAASEVQLSPNVDDDIDEESLSAPRKLEKRRSKEEALSTLGILQMILVYGDKIAELAHKVPRRKKPGHRVLKSVYNLRRLEINSKRKKILSG